MENQFFLLFIMVLRCFDQGFLLFFIGVCFGFKIFYDILMGLFGLFMVLRFVLITNLLGVSGFNFRVIPFGES